MKEIKRGTTGMRQPYMKPLAEILTFREEAVMDATSWNDGQGNTMPIHEGDPDDDGKGAKENNWEQFENLWD